MGTTKRSSGTQKALEEVLKTIIDDWYERVSGYYTTEEDGSSGSDETELKRFHDSNGHRIKFNKDNLDFTYGLRSSAEGDTFCIEISVNNKVEDFDYGDFKRRLFDHYASAGSQPATQHPQLRSVPFEEIFRLKSGIREAFTVEKRQERADIMRLTFQLNPEYLDLLTGKKEAAKRLIEAYCVSPFRNIYARVYRSNV